VSAGPRTTAVVAITLGLLAAAGGAPADELAAPSPVLERVLTTRDREVRTTLFSNGELVVSARRGGERILLRQITLPDDQFSGYLAAILRDASELARADELPSERGQGGTGVVTVCVAPGGPIRFEYSSMAVHDLATTRLIATLDDLEQQVINSLPVGDGVARWQPRVGDLVRLRGGQLAEVVELRDDGALLLEHRDTYINELVPPSEVRNVVIEIVEVADRE
jgi:hypothetical protein